MKEKDKQFLAFAFITWILSKFPMFRWIFPLFILLVLEGAELSFLSSSYSILECYNLFSGVNLSIYSFCFINVPNLKSISLEMIALEGTGRIYFPISIRSRLPMSAT